jgi:hypothetical protein
MDDPSTALEQLEKLKRVLEVAQRNGNSFFAENIQKEIAALEAGETSPIVQEYVINAQIDQQLGQDA